MSKSETPRADSSPAAPARADHGTEGSPQADRASKDALSRQGALSDRLKQLYDHVVDEPLPDEFKDLLAQLTPEADPANLDGGASPRRNAPKKERS